jgi:hypothetical protein
MSLQTPEAALRLAQLGFCDCRICGNKHKLNDALTTWFGGSLVSAVCMPCVSKGQEVVIRKNPRGIEVVLRRGEPALVVPARQLPDAPDVLARAMAKKVDHE